LRSLSEWAPALHLARRSGRLGGHDPDRLIQWLFREANRIGFSVPNLRAVLTDARETPQTVADWLRTRALADLARLDHEFSARPLLLGADVTVADVSRLPKLPFDLHSRLCSPRGLSRGHREMLA
jgi:glutathione S-transferase